ncbi:MAG: hypothetical protein ABR927_06405 [Bacteroidales bacterium]
MKRDDFIKQIIRYLLFGLLALIAVATGNRIISNSDCNSCPGKGICSGEQDCFKYLSLKDGKR